VLAFAEFVPSFTVTVYIVDIVGVTVGLAIVLVNPTGLDDQE